MVTCQNLQQMYILYTKVVYRLLVYHHTCILHHITTSQPKENKDLIVQVAKLSDKVTVSAMYTCVQILCTLYEAIYTYTHVLCSEFLSWEHFQEFQQFTKVFPQPTIPLLCKATWLKYLNAYVEWAYFSPLWWLLKVWGTSIFCGTSNEGALWFLFCVRFLWLKAAFCGSLESTATSCLR